MLKSLKKKRGWWSVPSWPPSQKKHLKKKEKVQEICGLAKENLIAFWLGLVGENSGSCQGTITWGGGGGGGIRLIQGF